MLEKYKLPKQNIIPYHKALKKAFFLIGDSLPLGMPVKTANSIYVEAGQKFILLDHCVGYKNKWSKILKYNAEDGLYSITGYILSEDVAPIENKEGWLLIKPDTSEQSMPDPFEQELDWTSLEQDIIFEDKKNGNFFVHYDTRIEKLSPSEEFINKNKNLSDDELQDAYISSIVEQSYLKAVSLILKENAKKSDIEYVKKIIDKYYLFAKVEDFFFPVRKCSTFRILVSIPKKYVYSEDIEDIINYESFFSNEEYRGFLSEDTYGGFNGESAPSEEQKTNYYTIIFNTYDEYKKLFDDIQFNLGYYSPIFYSRIWEVTPQINLQPAIELANVILFKQKFEEFILKIISYLSF